MILKDGDTYLRELFLAPVRECAKFRPAFGLSRKGGLDIDDFLLLYGADVFYSLLGLDQSAMYSAHKAAGGLTSLYRQIGVGAERLFRAILVSELNISNEQTEWSYEYNNSSGRKVVHALDAKIAISQIHNRKPEIQKWIIEAQKSVNQSDYQIPLTGAVFEVRQVYKSADSKRQNADLRYGIHAYKAGMLPVVAVFSNQINETILHRYRGDGMLVLTGVRTEDSTKSTFAFFKQVIGYDVIGFFDRNSKIIKKEMSGVIKKLLNA